MLKALTNTFGWKDVELEAVSGDRFICCDIEREERAGELEHVADSLIREPVDLLRISAVCRSRNSVCAVVIVSRIAKLWPASGSTANCEVVTALLEIQQPYCHPVALCRSQQGTCPSINLIVRVQTETKLTSTNAGITALH